jgi:hypothetical protein
MIRSTALAALALAFAPVLAHAALAKQPKQAEASIPFLNHGGIRDWRAVGTARSMQDQQATVSRQPDGPGVRPAAGLPRRSALTGRHRHVRSLCQRGGTRADTGAEPGESVRSAQRYATKAKPAA